MSLIETRRSVLRFSGVFSLIAGASLVAACGVSQDDQAVSGGAQTSDLVSENQLTGYELPDKTLALTFDDGPGNRTVELADYLADQGIHTTFFINGMRVPGRQASIQHSIERGHFLGNHTQHHLDLTTLSENDIFSEIGDTDAIIKDLQPNGPWLFRAPFGSWNAHVATMFNTSDYNRYVGSIFWNAGGVLTDHAAADWDCWGHNLPVERCADLYLEEIHLRGHGIVLMHDIQDLTIDMVKNLVPRLIAEGYTFTTLPEVPSIQRALAKSPANAQECESATLGYAVGPNACVQSRATKIWWRCVGGDWLDSTGPGDPNCVSFTPVAP